MRLIIEKDYALMSEWAANFVAKRINQFGAKESRPFVLDLKPDLQLIQVVGKRLDNPAHGGIERLAVSATGQKSNSLHSPVPCLSSEIAAILKNIIRHNMIISIKPFPPPGKIFSAENNAGKVHRTLLL